MTNQKKTIQELLERASVLQDKANYACAIDCLIQAVGLMAQTLDKPDLEAKPAEKELVPVMEGFILENQVALDSFKRNLTDIDVMVIWNLGLAAWDAAKKWKAKFPHE